MSEFFDDFESSSEHLFLFDDFEEELCISSPEPVVLGDYCYDIVGEYDVEDLYIVNVLASNQQELLSTPSQCDQYQLRLPDTTSLLDLHQYVCKQQQQQEVPQPGHMNRFFFYTNASLYSEFIQDVANSDKTLVYAESSPSNFSIPVNNITNTIQSPTISNNQNKSTTTTTFVSLYNMNNPKDTMLFPDCVHPIRLCVNNRTESSMLYHPFYSFLSYDYKSDMKIVKLIEYSKKFVPNLETLENAKGGSPQYAADADLHDKLEYHQTNGDTLFSFDGIICPNMSISTSMRHITLSNLPVRKLSIPVSKITSHATNQQLVKILSCYQNVNLSSELTPIQIHTQEYGLLYLMICLTEPISKLLHQVANIILHDIEHYYLVFQEQILMPHKTPVHYNMFRNCRIELIEAHTKQAGSIRARVDSCLLLENVRDHIYTVSLSTTNDSICTTTVPIIVLTIDNTNYTDILPLIDMQSISNKTSIFLIDTDTGELIPSAIYTNTNSTSLYDMLQQQIGWEHFSKEQFQQHIDQTKNTIIVKPNSILLKGKIYTICINYANYPHYFSQRRWKHIMKMKTKLDSSVLEKVQAYEDSISCTRLPFVLTQDKERVVKPLFFQFVCQ